MLYPWTHDPGGKRTNIDNSIIPLKTNIDNSIIPLMKEASV